MRKIIHLDMDAFFASVEMRDNPALRNVPMAVGFHSDRRGVLCTSNYLARQYGVRAAMPTAKALKLCPHLVLVPPHFPKYSEASKQVFNIFYEYASLVEPMSVDEAYLDVTGVDRCQNSATWMAQEIRQKIFAQTGLTCSAGISTNKLVAKLASDFNKPNGQFTVAPESVQAFMRATPIEKLWGIGKVTAKKLHAMGVKTCQDLEKYERHELITLFGKFGDVLYDFCRGVDEREVETEHERKSLGMEKTFEHDLAEVEIMKSQIADMVPELIESLKNYEDRMIKNLQVKIKYHDFKLTTIERAMPIDELSFQSLFEERWSQDPRPVRLLGIGVKFQGLKRPDPPCGIQQFLI